MTKTTIEQPKPKAAKVLNFGKNPESRPGKPSRSKKRQVVAGEEELNRIVLAALVDDLGRAEEKYKPYAPLAKRIESYRRELRHQTTDDHAPYEAYSVEGEEYLAVLGECGETHSLNAEIVKQAAAVLPEDVWWRICAEDIGVGKLRAALYAIGRSLKTIDKKDGARKIEVVRKGANK